MSVFGPVKFDIPASTQPLIKFARMLLDVADVDHLQLEFVDVKLMEARRRLEVNHGDHPGHLLFDMGQVLEDLLLRKRGGASGLAVASPSDKVLSGRLQVEMGKVECMIGDEPEPIPALW